MNCDKCGKNGELCECEFFYIYSHENKKDAVFEYSDPKRKINMVFDMNPHGLVDFIGRAMEVLNEICTEEEADRLLFEAFPDDGEEPIINTPYGGEA
jgi:hypothetical protein